VAHYITREQAYSGNEIDETILSLAGMQLLEKYKENFNYIYYTPKNYEFIKLPNGKVWRCNPTHPAL
jgi:hypothetical protein